MILFKYKLMKKNPHPILDLDQFEYHPLLQKLRTEISPNPENTVQKVDFIEIEPNIKLFVRRWSHVSEPVTKRMIVFHGAGGDSEYFVLLADQITQYGFEVICYDTWGQGYSDGPRGDTKDFSIYYHHANTFIKKIYNEQPDMPLFLFGESMGGTVLFNTIINNSELPPISGIISFAPGVKLRTAAAKLKDILSTIIMVITYPFHPGWLAYKMIQPAGSNIVNGKEVMNQTHFDYDATNPVHWTHLSARFGLKLMKGFSRAFKKGPNAVRWPTIIFLGSNDQAIDRKGVEDFFRRIPVTDKTLIITENCPHAMFTFDGFQRYWPDLINWVNNH
jgi:alpha-beta hydrolase superfamily lysophospholipase